MSKRDFTHMADILILRTLDVVKAKCITIQFDVKYFYLKLA